MQMLVEMRIWLSTVLGLAATMVLLASVKTPGRGWLVAFIILSLAFTFAFFFSDALSSQYAYTLLSGVDVAAWVCMLIFALRLKSPVAASKSASAEGLEALASDAPPFRAVFVGSTLDGLWVRDEADTKNPITIATWCRMKGASSDIVARAIAGSFRVIRSTKHGGWFCMFGPPELDPDEP